MKKAFVDYPLLSFSNIVHFVFIFYFDALFTKKFFIYFEISVYKFAFNFNNNSLNVIWRQIDNRFYRWVCKIINSTICSAKILYFI